MNYICQGVVVGVSGGGSDGGGGGGGGGVWVWVWVEYFAELDRAQIARCAPPSVFLDAQKYVPNQNTNMGQIVKYQISSDAQIALHESSQKCTL